MEPNRAGQMIVVARIGDMRLGIDIGQVTEILPAADLKSQYRSSADIIGWLIFRKEKIPVINLHKKLDMGLIAFDCHTRLIILEINGHHTSIIVDSVDVVTCLSRKDLDVFTDKDSGVVPSGDRQPGCDLPDRLLVLVDAEPPVFSFLYNSLY